jgi:polyhydroxyalkanoate synthase
MLTANSKQTERDLNIHIQQQMLDLYLGSLKTVPLLLSSEDVKNRSTEHDVVYAADKVKLLHYKTAGKKLHRTPLLIAYALVNRPYILDMENRSVVKNLVDQGFDVYLIDWGIPGSHERKLTINDYVNGYMHKCVDVVRNRSNSEKISLFGYCMGGTFSVIYTALHKGRVKNLITLAPSVDCSKDTTVFASLARFLEVDDLVDTVGNIPPALQYLFFMMLKPFKHYVGKYNEVAENMSNGEFVDDFVKLERWLWDTPPIPGEVFRQWAKDIYQQNLLIQNRLQIGSELVNMHNIDVPLLNIVAESDHLVSPESSKALNYAVSSKDKTLFIFPTGHIGLCASSFSQRNVWPKVGEWLMDRS